MASQTLGHAWYNELCNRVFCLDQQIEIVALLNNRGRIIEIIARDEGLNKELTGQKKEMLFMECALQTSLSKEYDKEFGKVRNSIVEREKTIVFSVQMDDYLLLTITKSEIDLILIQQKIIETVYNYAEAQLL